MNADWFKQAQALGLVDPAAVPVAPRPWPVVVLTGLAAWMAALPLVGALHLLFGAEWTRGPTDYLVGGLLSVLGVVLLRGRGRTLFLEQLGVPLLLTGLLSLAHALDRDMNDLALQATFLVLSAILIVVVPLAWLRQLLGVAAAVLSTLLCWQVLRPGESPAVLWSLAHGVAGVGLVMMALQHRLGRQAPGAAWAAVLEPVLAGWWMVPLFLLMWCGGPTYLVGIGWLGPMVGPGTLEPVAPGADGARLAMAMVSTALVLASAFGLVRAWAPAQAWRLLPPVLVLAAVAFQLPALGGCLALLSAMLATQRWRLALAAAVAALWVLGSFYYDWHLPLQHKALVLIGAGALLALWVWALARPNDPTGEGAGHGEAQASDPSAAGLATGQAEGPRVAGAAGPETASAAAAGPSWALRSIVLFGVLAALTVNLLILQKERLISQGRPVYVELGPSDPRSLTQGDYMQLSYRLPGTGWPSTPQPLWGRRPIVAVTVDERGIVHPHRLLAPEEAVPAGMTPLALSPLRGGWTFVTDAWYFREGDRTRWARARYGEFRLMPDGTALLVTLVDEDLKPL